MGDTVGNYWCGECQHAIRWVDHPTLGKYEIGHGMYCWHNPNRPRDPFDDENK